MLASYAANPEKSLGRLYQEHKINHRNVFQIDLEKVIKSNSFRRLEYKTQVMCNHEGDHYRNRLTHSIEVAYIARILAQSLHLNSDLAETISLAHDLGHTPFGHAGEEALNKSMEQYGGFCHNGHSIKILSELEKGYIGFGGLNLCWEVLEGIAKHNGIEKPFPKAIIAYNHKQDLKLELMPSLEAQVAAISDDIAYNAHDIEDGIRAKCFRLEQLIESVPLVAKIYDNTTKISDLNNILAPNFVKLLTQNLTNHLLEDVITFSQNMLKLNKINSFANVQDCRSFLVDLSDEVKNELKVLRKFLFDNFYRSDSIMINAFKCKKIVNSLFDLYFNHPECMPSEWRKDFASEQEKAEIIANYIAGMTDRYAIIQLNSLHNLNFNMI